MSYTPFNKIKEIINNDEKQVDRTQYLHKDNLGSIQTVTNAKGEVVIRNIYTPFGAITNTYEKNKELYNFLNLRTYTSHRQHFEHNLINMNGRTYDPTISRFTSPDLFIQAPTNSQSFNRYIYVFNNPLKYTDPSGYCGLGSEDDDDEDTSDDSSDNGGDGNDSSNDSDGEIKTSRFSDERGSGTVTFNTKNNNYDVTYDDRSGHGTDNDINYTNNSDGQFTTENTVTGEFTAGGTIGNENWNYKQNATSFQVNVGKLHARGNIHGYYYDNSPLLGPTNHISPATHKMFTTTDRQKRQSLSDAFNTLSDIATGLSLVNPALAPVATGLGVLSYYYDTDKTLQDEFNNITNELGELHGINRP